MGFLKNKWGLLALSLVVVGTSLTAALVVNDGDNDSMSDLISYSNENGIWDIIPATNEAFQIQFGYSNTIPVTGDFDGDGTNDYGLYDPPNGTWYFRYSSTSNDILTNIVYFGTNNTYPVVNDFDSDGITDYGTFSNGEWVIYLSATTSTTNFQLGFEGSYPVSGDFDGDGNVDYGVYEAGSAIWFIIQSSDSNLFMTKYGFADTLPVVTDIDNDGTDDYGCYYPPNGRWYIRRSSNPTNHWTSMYGYPGTIPFTGHFDEDGRTDFGVYHFSGIWYLYSTEFGHDFYVGTAYSEPPINARQFNYSIITTNALNYYNEYIYSPTNSAGTNDTVELNNLSTNTPPSERYGPEEGTLPPMPG